VDLGEQGRWRSGPLAGGSLRGVLLHSLGDVFGRAADHLFAGLSFDDHDLVFSGKSSIPGIKGRELKPTVFTGHTRGRLALTQGKALRGELHRASGEGEIGPAAVPRAEAPGHVPIAAELVRRTAPTRLRIDHVVNRHVGGAMAGAAIEVPPRTATEAVPDQEVI